MFQQGIQVKINSLVLCHLFMQGFQYFSSLPVLH